MGRPSREQLSRREREIMNALYRLGEASAAEVAAEMQAEEAFDSIRVTLGILEKKGHLKKRRAGNRNIYAPGVPLSRAKRSALRNLLHTFFEGSSSKAILSLLDSSKLSGKELDEIEALLRKRREDRRP
jgi:predicted transcriptional regulator